MHCTHGFNRTGYMIVTYLIERLNYSAEEALNLFGKARFPGIYEEMYLWHLLRRFGAKGCLVPIVAKPHWVVEQKPLNSSWSWR